MRIVDMVDKPEATGVVFAKELMLLSSMIVTKHGLLGDFNMKIPPPTYFYLILSVVQRDHRPPKASLPFSPRIFNQKIY